MAFWHHCPLCHCVCVSLLLHLSVSKMVLLLGVRAALSTVSAFLACACATLSSSSYSTGAIDLNSIYEVVCPEASSFIVHPNCSLYYDCDNFVPILKDCNEFSDGEEFYWNHGWLMCDFPDNVPECVGGTREPWPTTTTTELWAETTMATTSTTDEDKRSTSTSTTEAYTYTYAASTEPESKSTSTTELPTGSKPSIWTNTGRVIVIVVGVGALLASFITAALVYVYLKCLRPGRGIYVKFLTDGEVQEFHTGKQSLRLVSEKQPPSKDENTTGEGSSREDESIGDILGYDSKYEVAKEDFSVDLNSQLGSGQFGIVFSGQIKRRLGKHSNVIHVAVKTVRPNVPVEYFKALLSELKIMAHVGPHPHIVQLIGACTSEIKNGLLYVGVELCKCSLLQHLHNVSQNRRLASFRALDNAYVEPAEVDGEQYSVYLQDSDPSLARWAAEIAVGMEFLGSRRVVHGDLAARNVLLSFNLHAKICDFGLARRLVDYTYKKKASANTELPMKWLSIESLTKLHFTTKSDVWAFGVTCWEIFSLGNVPYTGTAFTWDQFVRELGSGERLPRPEHATKATYATMLECWRENPKERPTFSQLAQFFQKCAKEQDKSPSPPNEQQSC